MIESLKREKESRIHLSHLFFPRRSLQPRFAEFPLICWCFLSNYTKSIFDWWYNIPFPFVWITKNGKFFIILFNFDVKNSTEGNRGIHKAQDNGSHITNANTCIVVNGSAWCTTWQILKKIQIGRDLWPEEREPCEGKYCLFSLVQTSTKSL